MAAGTTFIKNGDPDRPVDDDARIGLLWDNFIDGVLGEEDREGVLDAKARAAVGGDFAADSGKTVQNRFKYLDLVDMNDGNLWVATADQSSVTVFVPYFDSMSAGDTIAVAYFDGLTRDYTIDMASADLDAEIASTSAHSLKVTKTSDGILFACPGASLAPSSCYGWTLIPAGSPELTSRVPTTRTMTSLVPTNQVLTTTVPVTIQRPTRPTSRTPTRLPRRATTPCSSWAVSPCSRSWFWRQV